MVDFPNIPATNNKGLTRLEKIDGGGVVYVGAHTYHDASNADVSWEITKYTYEDGDLIRIEVLTGSWDNRARLNWE